MSLRIYKPDFFLVENPSTIPPFLGYQITRILAYKNHSNKTFVTKFTISDIFITNRYQAHSLSEIIDYRYNDKHDLRRLDLHYHL